MHRQAGEQQEPRVSGNTMRLSKSENRRRGKQRETLEGVDHAFHWWAKEEDPIPLSGRRKNLYTLKRCEGGPERKKERNKATVFQQARGLESKRDAKENTPSIALLGSSCSEEGRWKTKIRSASRHSSDCYLRCFSPQQGHVAELPGPDQVMGSKHQGKEQEDTCDDDVSQSKEWVPASHP